MEEKKYTNIGSVTIGTDEYRDLIKDSITSRAEADDYRSKFWHEQTNAENLKKELDALKPKLESLNKFLKSDDAIATKYKLYQIEQQQEDNDNE